MRRCLVVLALLLSPVALYGQVDNSTIVSSPEPLPNCTPAAVGKKQPIIWDLTVGLPMYCSATNVWSPWPGSVTGTGLGIQGQPLLGNGDFEASSSANPVPGWFANPNATVSYDTSTPYEGLNSLVLVANSAGGGAQVTSNSVTQVSPGDQFFVQGVAKADGTVSANVQLLFYDKNNSSLGGCNATTSATSFTPISAVCVAPTNSVGMNVNLVSLPAGTAGTSEYDALYVYRTGQPVINNVLYVGGPLGPSWGVGDIGAQINAAYAALPSTGGKIIVVPQASGGCYTWTTEVVLNVASKYPILEGGGADSENSSGTAANGACLNWTSTSGTAMLLDYVPANGGGTGRNHGLRNLTLVNNQCGLFGGCGNTAIGVDYGTTNAGGQNAANYNLRINGFGTGMKIETPASSSQASWGITCDACSLSFNVLGLSIPNGIERMSFTHLLVLGNNSGISMGSSSGLFVQDGSCDANSTICMVSTGGIISLNNIWFENQGTTTMTQVNAGLTLTITGGLAQDDMASGATPSYWFRAPFLSITGMTVVSAGRVPALVFSPTQGGQIWGIHNLSPAILGHGVLAPISLANTVLSLNDGTHETGIEAPFFISDGGQAVVASGITPSAGWGNTASVPSGAVVGNNNRFTFVVTSNGTGLVANPTVAVVWPSPFPAIPQAQCKQVGGTGAIAFVTGEDSSITVNGLTFIWNGTPAGGGATYQFNCHVW